MKNTLFSWRYLFRKNVGVLVSTGFLFTFLIMNFGLSAQEKDKYDLLLISGIAKPESNVDKLAEQRAGKEELVSGKYFRIIQFLQIPTDKEKEELKLNGIELLVYLPNFSYFASIAESAEFSKLSSGGNLRAVLSVLPEYKLHPSLKNNNLPSDAEVVRGKADISLTYFQGLSVDVVVRELQSKIKGVKILQQDEASQLVKVRVKKKNVSKLALINCIQYVEPIGQWIDENNSGTTGHRSNTINTSILGGLSFDGTGVGVAVGEGNAYFTHVDFIGRHKGGVLPGAPHGTHVTGTLGGAGNIDPRYKGQAPGVNMIWSSAFDGIASVSAITALYNGVDAIRVTNHSLGEGTSGYTANARIADQQVTALPSVFNVHSSGNSGPSYQTMTGGFKSAKNSICVGNVDYKDLLSNLSSRGPSSDGRIKPDLCAKGASVMSTNPNNAYASMSGTSSSSPGVAGCFAQLIEAYRSMNSGNDPKLALLKGIVLNAADDLGNAGPDYDYGWGRINAWAAYNTIKDQRYLSSTIGQGGNNKHLITVPSNTSAVKVMVYWADPAAAAGVSKALINDLDITLVSSTQSYSPWELDFSSPATAAIKGIDRDNNMEQIFATAPPAGTYSLTVNGYLVAQGPQEYWVTYEIITDDIKVTFPIGGESLVPGETEYIRWDAYGSAGTFTIQYSSDSGAIWNTLSSTVAGGQRYYQWTVPSTLTGKGLVRVTRGAKSNTSQAKFSIMQVPTALNIDWRCPASFQLSWTAVAGATSYEAYLLGQKYMQSQGTTTGTNFWVQSPNTAVTWASVRALASNGQTIGRRAVAIQVPTAVTGCATSIDNTELVPYQVSVFPNPMTDHAIVSLNIAEEENISIKLMDVCGKEVASVLEGEKLLAGEHQFRLDNLTVSGIYMVMIKGEKGIVYEKVVVGGM